MNETKKITFKPGQLHALMLDEDSVVLVMSVQEARAVKEVMGRIVMDKKNDGTRWERGNRVYRALNGLAVLQGSSNIDGTLEV